MPFQKQRLIDAAEATAAVVPSTPPAELRLALARGKHSFVALLLLVATQACDSMRCSSFTKMWRVVSDDGY